MISSAAIAAFVRALCLKTRLQNGTAEVDRTNEERID
jgi:hypothetical protein